MLVYTFGSVHKKIEAKQGEQGAKNDKTKRYEGRF